MTLSLSLASILLAVLSPGEVTHEKGEVMMVKSVTMITSQPSYTYVRLGVDGGGGVQGICG